MKYWLFKSEPDCFSFAHLQAAPNQTTGWDGVRNYQARNFLRDDIQLGDLVLYYHSNADPAAIVGIAEVVQEAHPDPTAFDPNCDHYDPKSHPDNPTWIQVSIKALLPLKTVLPLPLLRDQKSLDGMELLRKGSRLSVQPVKPHEWTEVLRLGGLDEAEVAKAIKANQPKRKTSKT